MTIDNDILIATPHQGSSRLSQPEFSTSISRAMGLRRPLPESLQNEMQINGVLLQMMASSFKSLAADLKVWTFYETRDSDLTIPSSTPEDEEIPFFAPITSIRSAILDLHHEVDYPMLTNHIGCASFSGPNTQTMQDYLHELMVAVEQAHKLSNIKHYALNLEEKVKVEIVGFYKGTCRPPFTEAPITLWSTRKSLQEFKALGPSKCLEERLQEVSVPPQPHQFLRSTTRTLSPRHVRDPSIRISDSENQSHLKIRRGSLQDNWKHLKRFRWSSTNIHEAQKEIPEGLISRESRLNIVVSTPEKVSHDEIRDVEMSKTVTSGQGTTTGAPVRPYPADVIQPIKERLMDPAQSKTEDKLSFTARGQIYNPISQSLVVQNPETRELTSLPNPVMGERRGSIGGLDASPALRLVKPDAASRQLAWVHVPFNNPAWVSVSDTFMSMTPLTMAAGGNLEYIGG